MLKHLNILKNSTQDFNRNSSEVFSTQMFFIVHIFFYIGQI